MPGFITDLELKTSLAATLKVLVSDLPAYWDVLIPECNESAYYCIRGILLQRGFLVSQIDNWDRGREYQIDLGLYWLLVKGAGLHEYDDKFILLLDRRKELETVVVESFGNNQIPAGDPPGAVFNRLNTIGDRWTLETPL